MVWANSVSLAATQEIAFAFSSSGYLDVSVPRVRFSHLWIQCEIPLRVGFPIRKSADQSLFAAPHGLSQRTTSFIASQRQGIHRTPLVHSITLIASARSSRSLTAHPTLRRSVGPLERPVSFFEFCPTAAVLSLQGRAPDPL